MATICLETPEAFDFKNPDDWARWKARYEQFRLASGLSTESETRQVSTLLYCMGQDADNVLTSTNISDEDRKKYTSVMAKFEEFFKVRKNRIYERARFNRRDQREGEDTKRETSRTTTVVINGKEVKFKLDTGAEVTAVSEQTYNSLTGIKLQKASRILYGPARQALVVIGQFTEKITHQHRSAQQTIFVI